MKIGEFCSFIENHFPIEFQEEYDNSGLQIGKLDTEIKGILVTLDITEEIINEAIKYGDNLILSHHPLIFNDLKRIVDKNYIEKIIIKAIENDIAIYSAHTNIDNNICGINNYIAKMLKLKNIQVLSPSNNLLFKLVTFVPESHENQVREAIFKAGAGYIDNYDMCSFNIKGIGTFRPLENTSPFLGEIGQINYVNEIKIETIVPKHLLKNVINSLLESHPYEEVAYDIYPLHNKFCKVGSGIIGELDNEINILDFFEIIKKSFDIKHIRHSKINKDYVKKIAICTGSGGFLIKDAINNKADLFLTGEIKYHQYFNAEDKVIIAEIGHYESEKFIKEFFYDFLNKKLTKFAIHKSKIDTNPIKYY